VVLHRPFQLSYSDKLFFQACVLLEFLSDGAVKGVTVRNHCIN
jgi:hypothetical protein